MYKPCFNMTLQCFNPTLPTWIIISEFDVPVMKGCKWYSLKELRPFITGTSNYACQYEGFNMLFFYIICSVCFTCNMVEYILLVCIDRFSPEFKQWTGAGFCKVLSLRMADRVLNDLLCCLYKYNWCVLVCRFKGKLYILL